MVASADSCIHGCMNDRLKVLLTVFTITLLSGCVPFVPIIQTL